MQLAKVIHFVSTYLIHLWNWLKRNYSNLLHFFEILEVSLLYYFQLSLEDNLNQILIYTIHQFLLSISFNS